MKKFDQELDDLRSQVFAMADMAKEMLQGITESLRTGETSVARHIYALEYRMDQMELDIDHEAIRLLTVYSPVASDLRFVLGATKIASELERIGDQTTNVCKYIELVAGNKEIPSLKIVIKMCELVASMLDDTVESFRDADCDKAHIVIRTDNRVDAFNDQVLQEVLSMTGVSTAVSLGVILIARAIERMGDQCTNICEEIVYFAKGDDIRHSKLGN
ncbi:MAG: phosphate transport system protein [Pirellulaceae bacterium]|jgi:phosphate transport system protein